MELAARAVGRGSRCIMDDGGLGAPRGGDWRLFALRDSYVAGLAISAGRFPQRFRPLPLPVTRASAFSRD